MDDRDRASPVALSRNAPVSQPEIDLPLTLRPTEQFARLKPPRDLVHGVGNRHAVEESGVYQDAVAIECVVADDDRSGVDICRADDRRLRQAIFVGEIQIALIVGWATEDCARAVIHQDEIGRIDRQEDRIVEGMNNLQTCVETLFLGRFQHSGRSAHPPAFVTEFFEIAVFLCERPDDGMIDRQPQERGAEDRIRTGRENLDVRRCGNAWIGRHRETHPQPFGSPDPVSLHQADFLGPLIERIEPLQQVFRKGRDLEEPLREVALFDQRPGPPTPTVDDLLVREYGLVDRIPIHARGLAIDQARLQEIQKNPLLVLVIARVAGRDFTRPIERQAHRLELATHRVDVRISPGRRVRTALHGGIFRRHAEGVPAHGVKDVVAASAHVTGDHVAHRVVADVPHVDAPRWVGKHLEHVIFRACVVVAGLEDLTFVPDTLPVRLGFAGVVAVGTHFRAQALVV